ncbi:MAG TPA: alpha-2-macroglobulin [Polyangia bacterium]
MARRLGRGLARGLSYLFGHPAWSPPPWARALGRGGRSTGAWMRAEKAKAFALLAALALTAGGGAGLLRWWEHRPKPVTVSWQVIAPEVTRIEEKLHPRPLRLEFEDSVAPLDKIDKPVTAGVAFEPRRSGLLSGVTGAAPVKLEGTWRWISDRALTFTPKVDWPIGEELTIRLAKKGLVATHVRLADYERPFTTPVFQARVLEAQFYQDPVNPTLKKVITTFSFTHPVDPASFEPRVKMHLVPSDKEDPPSDYEAHISYDRWKGSAYVHSTPIAIPRHDATLFITLAPGTKAARGGPPESHELTEKVVIPGLYNFLKISAAQLSLVDNERYEPEQALIVETSIGSGDKDVAKALHATVLPEKTADGKPASYPDPAQLSPDDLKRGTPVTLTAIASEAEFPTQHSFKVKVPVGRQVYVHVEKGLHGFGGYVLGEAFQTVITVPAYPRMLRILQDGALLAQSGDHRVPVLARDIPAIKYEIGRVLPGQIQHLVTQSAGTFARPSWNYRFDDSNVAQFFEETHTLVAAPGKPEYDGLDLSKYLAGGGDERRGLFLLRAQSFDPRTKAPLGDTDTRLILVTDLGLMVKENADGSHDLFVQSTRSGEPVANARVDVLGKNGQVIVDATTGKDGHASLPTFKDFRREREPALYLVSSGRDQSFLPIGRYDRLLNTSRFDVGGVSEEPTAGAAKGLTAFLFSDRGIYRPGDEIRVGVIVKSKDWSARLAGLPLEVIVTDARGLPVKDQKLKLSASGFEEVRHTTPEVAAAGTYAVNLYVVKDGHPSDLLGSTTVQVREFLPDRMKIRAAFSEENPEGWVAPGDLKARVTLANLFGTPAANHKVRAKMTLSPWVPSFGRWRDYRFFDPLKPKEGVNETLADATTNDDGIAELDLGLKRFATATYRLGVVAEGFEAEGGRSVVADASAVVSPLPYLLGYKADGELGYMSRGSERHLDMIAIAPNGKRIAVDGLRAITFERKYVSVLARQDNGAYRYQSVKKELELASKPFEIGAEGAHRKLPTDKPGDYALVIRDASDRDLQRIEYSVTGYGNLSREVEKNAELQVALAKTDVAPGDDLEMQIKAPYTGAGLITIERDHVYAWKWFKTATNATVEHIRVPDDLEGGGYVSVSFIRDPGSQEVFMSPLSHGIVPFSISRARRQVKVQVDSPALARPGEPFHMKVKTDKPTKLVVFAVDEGILRVAGYKAPDPLGFFFQKRALSVKTLQILDMILPEFQRLVGSAAPGGDADAAVGANLNPFRRKQQKPVAFWSGIIDAGAKERDVVYDVPDSFNGTLRVMAVAVAPDALGAFEGKALVRGDFVISPNVPTFLAPGDETEVSVSVANNVAGSGKTASVTLAMVASSGLEPLDGTQRQLTIAELREASATFKLRARAPLGAATLTFTASLGTARSRLTSELSVRPPTPFLATFQAGHLHDKQVTVPVARHLYGDLRHVEAGLSSLPLGLTHGLRAYLEKFPHGCTEQIVSQVVPPLVLGKHAEFGYAPQVSAAAVARWLDLLRARQNEDGSFGRWAANPAVDKLASIWATHMLLEAKERGFAVPVDVLKSATAYLQAVAAEDVEGLTEAGVRAYAIYVLTRGGMVTTAFASALEKHLVANHPKEWKGELAGLYLAATYHLLKQDRAARPLVDAIAFGKSRSPDSDWYYDRLAYDAQALYVLARHFPERAARLSPAELDAIVDPIFRGAYNTFSSAWSILALEAYGQTAEAAPGGTLSADELVGGQPRALTLPQSLLPVASFSPNATAIRFGATGPFGAYFVVSEAGFDVGVPDKPSSKSLEVFRTFEGADGKPVTSVKLGEEITAVVRLRTLDRPSVGGLAIVDLLPGGFEPVVQAAAPPAGGEGEAEREEGDPGAGHPEGEDEEGNGGATDDDNAVPGDRATAAQPYALSIALPGATFQPEFGDVREDRVVLYGAAESAVKELKYAIKATNVGTYVVPPIQATALYDSTVIARGTAGKLVVVPR